MLRRTDILGAPVSAVDMEHAVADIARWADAREGRYVCAADVNSVMQARRNPAHMAALRGAALVVPDGTPLMWAARARGDADMGRVPGPDLMLHLCETGVERGWRHYFYGGADGVAVALAAGLSARFPGLRVAGHGAPPFRPMTAEEREQALAGIAAADPHVLWVGLGCPKQEIWMLENAARLPRCVVIGVGAAFDFHSNRIPRAPAWMRRNGLEWLHRLVSEPRRLWRRYLLIGPEFLLRAGVEAVRLRIAAARSGRPMKDLR